MRGFLVFSLLVIFLLAPVAAFARDTEVFLPAQAAAESEKGIAYLLDIPFYLKGQKHPKVAKKLIQVTTNQSTRGMFRSDEASCTTAFLTSVKALQEKAQREGGDAVVDIVSITRDKLTESPTDFRCIAGTAIVHVGLKGHIVKFAK